MNYACPHCAADLRQQRPINLTRAGAGGRFVCPACGGPLTVNPHPAEKLFFPGVIVALVALNVYSGFSGIKVSLVGAALMLALVLGAAYAVRNFVPPRDWPRYVAGRGKRPPERDDT